MMFNLQLKCLSLYFESLISNHPWYHPIQRRSMRCRFGVDRKLLQYQLAQQQSLRVLLIYRRKFRLQMSNSRIRIFVSNPRRNYIETSSDTNQCNVIQTWIAWYFTVVWVADYFFYLPFLLEF